MSAKFPRGGGGANPFSAIRLYCIEKHAICYRLQSCLSIQYVHDDLCKHLGIDSSTYHPDRYSNLFLNAYINRHVHAKYLKWSNSIVLYAYGMFLYIVLTPISTTSGLWSTGNTRKYQQIDVYIYQCESYEGFMVWKFERLVRVGFSYIKHAAVEKFNIPNNSRN